MNLLIELFFFIFTIQDSLSTPKLKLPLNGTKNQLIDTSKSRMKDSKLKDIDVFYDISSIWYNMYPQDKASKAEKYMIKCEDGEYLNLCGECVGGNTEKDDSFGLDDCGICHGLQRCSPNGCKEASIESLDEEEGNCTQILGMKPSVVDLTDSSTKTTVNLIASDLNPKDITCSALIENKKLDVQIRESENGLILNFEKAKDEGKILMLCNTSEGIEFKHELLAVSSAKLKPISSDRSFLIYGQESRMIITVSNIFALADLICFAKQNGNVVYKYWTNDIQGNSLSSEVFCERIWPNDPSEMEFGVAYSEEAMEKAQTIKVAVNVPSPKVIQTEIKNGQVIVFFDINIPPSANCSSLKGLNLGSGAKCEVVANEFRIQFGQGSLVKKGQKFSINLLESKTYNVLLQETKGALSAKIDGPETVCSGEMVEYRISGDENLGGNWSIGYSGKGKGTPGNRQRMNLLLWRNVRENMKKWSDSREITLNTSLLMEGVDYEVKATGKKDDGTNFEMKKNLKVTKSTSPLVYVKGSKKIDFKTDLMFEAQVLCTASQNMDVHWKIGNIEQNGPKLFLKASNLNTKMTSVTVELTKENKPISQGKLDLSVEKSEMEPLTYFDEVVVGTGHDIHIATNKEHNDYNYEWSCSAEMSKCKTAGRPSKDVEEVGTLDGTDLIIPRKTLPVGKYEIEISSSNGLSTKKKVHVRVVPGEPPFISIISVKTGSDIKIELRVSDVISSCEFSIDSLMENNYAFIDLKEVFTPKKLEGTPLNPTSFDFIIEIPENVLKFGTKYKLRLNANCGALTQSYVVLDIPIREVVKTGELEVNPLKGDALTTPFKLNLKNSALSETIYDFGFIFNETSYVIDKKLEPFTTIYSLPGKIKPFAKICQVGKICKTILGPEIDVEAKMNAEAAKNVLESYKMAVKSGMYDVAVGNAKIISEGAKTSEDYGTLSSEVDDVLTNKMENIVSMLEKDDSVITDALDLLQSSLKIVDMVETPGTSREKILKFRDSIQTAFRKKSGKMVENALLKRESRAKRQTNRTPKRTKEDVTVDTVERFLESSVWLIHNSANKTQILMEKDSLIKKRIPDYLTDLCNSINTTPRHANSSIVELSATKVKNNGNRQEMRFPECSGVCGNGTGQIILSKSFFDKYNNSDGVCIGAAYLPNDFLSEITNATSEENIIRQSGIYMSKIFRYEQNVAIKEVENATSKPIGVFRLLLWSGVEQSPDLKCHTWMNTTGWTHFACKTIKQLTINGRNALECKCPLQGIHAIFKNITTTAIVQTTVSPHITNVPTKPQLPEKTTESTTKTTPVMATVASFTKKNENYRYTAGFLINENFNKTVGTRKTAFEENIKNQLIDKLKIPNETFIEANNQEENVKVTLKLECEDTRVPSVVIEMAKVLSRGDLKLKGLDNKDLSVPGQNLELYLSDKKSSSSSSYIILISCGIFVLITSVIAILLSGVFLKWRRELRAMNFIESMENHSRPKYLRLHESSSMEAIEQTYSSSQQRPGELDSGIVLTVDPNKMSSKYQPFDQITSHA